MEKYLCYLEPYTFCFAKKKDILIYNCISSSTKLFENVERLNNLITGNKDFNLVYSIELTEEDLVSPEIIEFIEFIRESFSGDIIDTSRMGRPIVFPPNLKFQSSVQRLKQGSFRELSDEIYQLLDEISIYIGGCNPNSLLINIDVIKQFDYCFKTNGKYLEINGIRRMIHSLINCNLKNINIIGGNVFTYPDLEILLKELNVFSFTKTIYSTYKDSIVKNNLFQYFSNPNYILKILIDFPADRLLLERNINALLQNSCSLEYLFAIKSIDEFEETKSIIATLNLRKVEIRPVFTGDNFDFFEEYVFLSQKDLLESKMTKKDIFINQSLNTNYFGKLKIMPSGKVYTDFNRPHIGRIDTPLLDLLYLEMSKTISWLRIRDQKPCTDCVFQWFCPSPSGYEQVIRRPNLCKIN